MITQLLISAAIVVGLMAIWYVISRAGLQGPGYDASHDRDPLEGRVGCGGCMLAGKCIREDDCPQGGLSRRHRKPDYAQKTSYDSDA